MKKICLSVTVVSLFGCSTFTPPQGHPVLDDRINGGGGQREYVQFATTPERRVVLMNIVKDRTLANLAPSERLAAA